MPVKASQPAIMHAIRSMTQAAAILYLGLVTHARAQADCSDPSGIDGLTPACFLALDVPKAITEWTASSRNKNNCPYGFAQCFLGSISQNNGNCTIIAESTCQQPQWQDYKAAGISVQYFYIAYNLYAIWSCFNSYYTAIGDAQSLSSSTVGAVTTTFNVKEQESPLGDILTAIGSVISLGLARPQLYQALNAILQATQGLKYGVVPGSDASNLLQ